MAVVVNEFEVVSAPPPREAEPPAAPASSAPDPAKAEDELARMLRHLHQRAARLHAC